MRAATSSASSKEVAMPAGGYMMPRWSSRAEKRSRSSARSIAAGWVPKMGTPASSSRRASLSGVWPPSVTTTPSGRSTSMTSMTSS